jgi:hypothetical protein
MTKLDYGKAKCRPAHEREISDDVVTAIVARARGPKKADLRAEAEHAIKVWRHKSQPGDARQALRPVPAFTTAGPMKLHTDAFPWPPWEEGPVSCHNVTCACGHSGVVKLTPDKVLTARIRCSVCGTRNGIGSLP